MQDITVVHEPERSRFAVYESGQTAYLSYHVLEDGTLDFAYTYTPLAIRGRGIATAIIRTALEYAKDQGKKIEPTCPFVATYIDRHRNYQEISTQH